MDTLSKKVFNNVNMAGSLVSETINLQNMLHVSYHMVWSGATADGDLYLDVSAEIGAPNSWENIASVTVSGAGSQLWMDRNAPYLWARLRYVPISGTGTLNGDIIMKGSR